MTPQQQKAYTKAARLCSMKEYCEVDIRNKIKNFQLSPEQEDELITTLMEEKYLSNERYVLAFVNDKIKFNKWGKQKVRQSLYHKQIAESLINKTLESFPETEYLSIIKIELEKKQRSLNESDLLKRKQKLLQFGASRGYEIDIMYKLID